jgi:hypothetical protein
MHPRRYGSLGGDGRADLLVGVVGEKYGTAGSFDFLISLHPSWILRV